MGKVSLSAPQPTPVTPSTPVTPIKTQHQVKSNLLPELTRKEWISVLTAVFIVFSVGFSLGFVVNIKRANDLSNVISIVDPLITIEKDLNDKLKLASKQLDKIDDEDLYKVVMEAKGKKIQIIKEQLKDIETFRSNHINSITVYYNNKKDELKKNEILYHR
tara:strand:- start:957 stop:1439 length:483 start_codon:yes stop_codon:yes gene_type:complete